MTQKDLKGRTVFQIASENNFYIVLQSPEIGTIVKKMWNGKLIHEGFLSSSSLFRFLEDTSMGVCDSFNKFEERDSSKSYFYQFSLWKESCSMRYWAESISTICLIVIYNLYIYFLVNSGQIMSKYTDLQDHTKFLLYLYITWTWCINYNLLNHYVFCKLAKRKFIIDVWSALEILLSIFSLLLLIDTKEMFGNSLLINSINVLQESDEMSDWPFVIRALILSVNDILVWTRITGILLTFKDIGPLIRMIYLLSYQTAKYLIVYASYITCFSGIFTSIFYRVSSQFSSFSLTFTTLFGGFIYNFDTFGFDKNQIFGAIMVLSYVTLSGIILINLLIALLSNVYKNLSLEVDASHRSVLINYFRRYKWNRQYGFLLLLTTPINICNLFALFFFILLRKKYSIEILSTYITKIFYMIFYFPFMLILSIFYNIILIPFCYIKGIINTIFYEKQSKSNFLKKIFNLINWITLGPLFLSYILIREVYSMFLTVFQPFDVITTEKDRIKKYMNEDDVILFLQFIHNRSKEDKNDLHTLFIQFLLFEQEKKAERDATIKEKSYYLDKINNAAQKNSKIKAKRTSSSYFVVSKTRIEGLKIRDSNSSISKKSDDVCKNQNNQEKVSGTFVKRNIIIIEILENFLIDDGSDNYIVDLEQLKMLLPKTWNIDNSYIKRLVYTNITSVNRAVTKLKSSKNTILREQLLNKISIYMIELDKSVDNEKIIQTEKNNKNLSLMKNSVNTKKTNSLNKHNKFIPNLDNQTSLSHEYGQKLFYEEYMDLLVKIAKNLQSTNETNKKNSEDITKMSINPSFKETNINNHGEK